MRASRRLEGGPGSPPLGVRASSRKRVPWRPAVPDLDAPQTLSRGPKKDTAFAAAGPSSVAASATPAKAAGSKGGQRHALPAVLVVGSTVEAKFKRSARFFRGVVKAVRGRSSEPATLTYSISFVDGDRDDAVLRAHVRGLPLDDAREPTRVAKPGAQQQRQKQQQQQSPPQQQQEQQQQQQQQQQDQHNDACEVCDQVGDLLCCDTCTLVYHVRCLDPPLKKVPDFWPCPECVQLKARQIVEERRSHKRGAAQRAARDAVKLLKAEAGYVHGQNDDDDDDDDDDDEEAEENDTTDSDDDDDDDDDDEEEEEEEEEEEKEKEEGGAPARTFSSQYRGVTKCGRRWLAQVQHQGATLRLGRYDSEREAAERYDSEAVRLRGLDNAVLNFPEAARRKAEERKEARARASAARAAAAAAAVASGGGSGSSSSSSRSGSGSGGDGSSKGSTPSAASGNAQQRSAGTKRGNSGGGNGGGGGGGGEGRGGGGGSQPRKRPRGASASLLTNCLATLRQLPSHGLVPGAPKALAPGQVEQLRSLRANGRKRQLQEVVACLRQQRGLVLSRLARLKAAKAKAAKMS